MILIKATTLWLLNYIQFPQIISRLDGDDNFSQCFSDFEVCQWDAAEY